MFRIVLILITVFNSIGALAFDFSDADKHFVKRENSQEDVKQAMELYDAALSRVSGDDLVYAVGQIAHLDYYKGDILTNSGDSTTREEIFSHCLDKVELISSSNINQEVGAYYYWKAACRAMWAQAVGTRAMPFIKELRQNLYRGMEVGPTYMRGGIYRIAAAVFTVDERLSWFNLYSPERSIEFIDTSLEQATDIYFAYSIKAFALKALNRNDEAIQLLQEKIAALSKSINDNTLDPSYAPENKFELERMKGLLGSIHVAL